MDSHVHSSPHRALIFSPGGFLMMVIFTRMLPLLDCISYYMLLMFPLYFKFRIVSFVLSLLLWLVIMVSIIVI